MGEQEAALLEQPAGGGEQEAAPIFTMPEGTPPATPPAGDPPAEGTPTDEGTTFASLLSEDVAATVPEKYRGQSPEQIAKSLTSVQQFLGGKLDGFLGTPEGQEQLAETGFIRRPGDDATPEERAAFHQAIGAPAAATEYQLPEAYQGRDVNEDFVGGFQQVAHESGLTQQGYEAITQYYLDQQTQLVQNNQKFMAEHYGADYAAVLNQANAGAKVLKPEFITMAKQQQHNPLVVELLRIAGQGLGDDTSPGSGDPPNLVPTNFEEKKTELKAIIADPKKKSYERSQAQKDLFALQQKEAKIINKQRKG